MYLPSAFIQDRHDLLHAFMLRHAFATVIGVAGGEPVVEHVPLLVDAEDGIISLRGHVAIGNALWTSPMVTAVFSGPHGYISAAWYETPDTVPTWNYQVVHARGPLTVIEAPARRLQVLKDLADRFEGPGAERWQRQLSPAVQERLLGGIVFFEIRVEDLIGKWKLSQNHPKQRVERVVAALTRSGTPEDQALAAAMISANGLSTEPPHG